MKIALVCGSLEPGKDGVGDYCRVLAKELITRNHVCLLVALKDPFVAGVEDAINDGLSMIRIAPAMDAAARFRLAGEQLNKFSPDIVSLQIVPYGLNPRGIMNKESTLFKKLTAGYPVHIMFHELWLGVHTGASWKELLKGKIQKYFILKLIRSLRPFAVNTNTGVYKFLLNKENVPCSVLPLFGNIPVHRSPETGWIYDAMKKENVALVNGNRGAWWVFLFFGSMDGKWDPSPLMYKLSLASEKYSKNILICSSGKLGYGEDKWNEISGQLPKEFYFVKFGELEPQKISDLMSFADFGLSTYPDILVGKSGSIAAMNDHQLPVIISNYSIKIKNYKNEREAPDLLVDINNLDGFLEKYIGKKDLSGERSSAAYIAEHFIKIIKR